MKKLHVIQKTFLIIMLVLSILALYCILSVVSKHNYTTNESIFIGLFCVPIALSFIFSLTTLLEKKS